MANTAYTIRTPEKDAIFFTALGQRPNIVEACRASGYARQSVYYWRKTDKEFAEQMQQCIDIAVENLEGEIYRRAYEGVAQDTPVIYKGKVIATIRKREYSDTLAIFLLKAHKRELYGDNITVKVEAQVKAELTAMFAKLEATLDPSLYELVLDALTGDEEAANVIRHALPDSSERAPEASTDYPTA